MPTIAQVEEMEMVLAFIEAHQENWDQGTWEQFGRSRIGLDEAIDCGTSCCFAGWATLLAGEQIENGVFVTGFRDMDGQRTVPDWAVQHFGLPVYRGDPEEGHLFGAENTLDDLRLHIKQYRADAEALLPEGPTS